MKHLIVILFTIVALSANADSGGIDDSSCIPSNHLTQKQHNYTQADIDSISTLNPCGLILDAKVVIANLSMIATKDDIRYYKSFIEKANHEYQRIENAMKETNSISLLFEYLAYIVFSIMPFYLLTVVIKASNKEEYLRGVLVTLSLGLFGGLTLNVTTVYTGMTLGTLGSLGYINYDQKDNSTFFEIRDADLSKISIASDQSNTNLITAIKYNSIQNTVTDFYLKETLDGRLELDATILGDEDDIDRPTEREFRYYQKHCEKASSYGLVDKDFSFLVANFNYTNLPVSGDLVSGGDTTEFNCSDHYGKRVNTVSLTSNAVVTTDRFMMGLFEKEMSQDLNWLESIKSSFDSTNGTANLILEKTAEVASRNIEIIPSQLKLALSAIKESETSNISIKETSQYKNLINSHKNRMGNVYDNGEIEGMSVMQEMGLNAIQREYFKSATLFGYAPEDGEELDYIGDNFGIGFYYFSPFVDETSKLALEIECINTDGKLYQQRLNYASYYNNLDLDTPHHLTQEFGGVSGAHCYKYVGDKLVAGANPEDLLTLRDEVKYRDKSLSVWFDSIDQASLELIMSKPNLNDDILVDYLNTLDTSFQSTIDSYLILTKVKQELIQIFNTVDDSFSINFAMPEMIEDVNYPATYFNYARFYGNVYQQDLEQIAKSKGLKFFNLEDYFNQSVKTLIASENERATEAQNEISALLMPRCSLKDQHGDCKASVAQNLKANRDMMLAIAENLTIYKFTIDVADGACDLTSSSSGGSLKMGGAKGNPYIMILCGSASALDTVNEIVVAPAISISWVLTLASTIALLIPSLADLFLLVFAFVFLFVPIVISPVVLIIEMIRNLMYQFSNDPKSFDKLTEFDVTVNTFKTLIVSSSAFCLVALIGIWLYTSGGFGGGLFDTLIGMFISNSAEETFLRILLTLLVVVIVFALVAIKFIPSILSNVYDQTMQYMKVQTSRMSESSNAFTGFMVGYFGMRAFNDVSKVQGNSLGANKKALKSKARNLKDKLNTHQQNTGDKINVDVVDNDKKEEPEKDKSEAVNETPKKEKVKTYDFEGDISKMSKDELKQYEEDIMKHIDSDENPKK